MGDPGANHIVVIGRHREGCEYGNDYNDNHDFDQSKAVTILFAGRHIKCLLSTIGLKHAKLIVADWVYKPINGRREGGAGRRTVGYRHQIRLKSKPQEEAQPRLVSSGLVGDGELGTNGISLPSLTVVSK